MSREVLVTGCHGYIGPHVVRELRSRGHYVVGVDRQSADHVRVDEFIQGDLVDPSTCEAAMENVDSVFHLAASRADWGLSDEAYYRDNVTATEILTQVGSEADVRDWVHFSTVGVHGPSMEPLEEDAPFEPDTTYGKTKARAEKVVRTIPDRTEGARVVIIRPSAVYGPACPENTNVYRLIDALHKRRFLMIGDGQVPKTTSYIENLVVATFFAAADLEPGVHTYIYVDQPVLTTRELVDRISRLLGRPPPSLHLPLPTVRGVARVFDVVADVFGVDLPITADRIEKFCTPTHYRPAGLLSEGFIQPFGHEAALEATVEGYLSTREGGMPQSHYLRDLEKEAP